MESDARIREFPEVLHESLGNWLARAAQAGIALPENHSAAILKTVACSEFAARVMLSECEWFEQQLTEFDAAPDNADLEAIVAEVGDRCTDPDIAKSELRRFRNRFMLRVYWRDLHGLADLDESLQQLSLLADRLLDAATRFARRSIEPRFGLPKGADGNEIPLLILGMGKLGGRELNFSSDIDLIFCYPEDGETDGKKATSAHEYFGRLSRLVIAMLDEVTNDGFAFRIDTRLRPFGDSGPPVVSFPALEAYLLQHGRDWERYAYVKARVVGPQPGQAVLADLYDNLLQPFVYRRYLDYGVFESLRDMHAMIAAEVRRKDLADNVKLGPGGIRETEFVVQAIQLVRGGSEPALQDRELQRVLPKLAGDRDFGADGVERLLAAYRFLRRLENFIQALRDQQTHDLPKRETDRARLTLAMGFSDWEELIAALNVHRQAVSEQFAAVAFGGASADEQAEEPLAQLWDRAATDDEWATALRDSFDEQANELGALLAQFSSDTATRQTDSASQARLRRLIPLLVAQVATTSRPVAALRRCIAVVERVLRRSAYLALLYESRTALSRFVDLCERSQYIADQLARFPVLLDELLDPRIYSGTVTRDDIARDLAPRLDDADDSETRMQKIAHFQRACMFRIAVADFNNTLPIMKVSDALTWLAEVILDEALRAAWADLVERHGTPQYEVDGKLHDVGFGIVGYGKLGGLELSYGSDLDIIFLHNSRGRSGATNGDKQLDNTMFFSRLVRRLTHFLTTQTGSGELYEIDTRLRPDGRSGVLVTSLEGFEAYQEENAWTWEHQALLRARPVAGDPAVAEAFEQVRHETLTKRVRRDKLRDDVTSMKSRMRKELDRSTDDGFDLKHGRGGIGDIEFLVQYLVLSEAAADPAVIHFSDNIRQLDALVAADILSAEEGGRLQDIYKDYRLQLHHLALDGQPALVNPDLIAAEREFVIASWRERLG